MFPSTAEGTESAVYSTGSKKGSALGQLMALSGGRLFRFVKNDGAALAGGAVVQAAEQEANHANLTVGAASVAEARTLTLTNGIVPITIDYYKGGFLYVNDGVGQGYIYEVRENTNADISGTCTVTLKTGLVEATNAETQCTLIKHPCDGALLAMLEPSDAVLGITPCAVPADEYFWAQVRGPAAVLQEGTLFAGKPISASRRTRGAVSTSENLVMATATRDYVPDTTHAAAQVQRDEAGAYDLDTLKLSEVSGHSVLPEMILGYCIDPRATSEYALVNLAIV